MLARALIAIALVLWTRSAMAVSASGGLSLSDGTLSGVGPQVDVYNYSGSSSTYTTTWTKPSWATTVHIWCVGGGQGGQGGNKGTSTSTNASAGGSSGSFAEGIYSASAIDDTLYIGIGKGSSGGSGATSDNATGGTAGTVNDSYVGSNGCNVTSCLVWAYGGNNSSSMWTGTTGVATATSQPCTGYASYSPGVGGAGGGITSSVGTGQQDGGGGCMSPGSQGSAGTSGSLAGSAGSSYATGRRVGGGGGGGFASLSAGVSGGAGGAGGSPGGGGGGGGAGLNATSNGGVGGAGGNGICVIVSY